MSGEGKEAGNKGWVCEERGHNGKGQAFFPGSLQRSKKSNYFGSHWKG